ILDEVMGQDCFISQIAFTKTSGLEAVQRLSSSFDYILWYARKKESNKYRALFRLKEDLEKSGFTFVQREDSTRVTAAELTRLKPSDRPYAISDLTKPGPGSKYDFVFRNETFTAGSRWWGTTPNAMTRLTKADRIQRSGKNLRFVRFHDDAPTAGLNNLW